MKKILFILLMLLSVFSTVNVTQATVFNGDMTIEEGADISVSNEEHKLNEEKLQAMNVWLSSRVSGASYMNLAVPTCQQETNYYCGPATVQQTLKFHMNSVPSQTVLANQLGTTTDGTDMTKISGVLNNNLGYTQYSLISIGTQTDWINKVTYALSINKPVILDIKATSNSGWPYTTAGHFLNVSGYDRRTTTAKTKITDPWIGKLGDTWYNTSTVYAVNNAHFRQAMIW